MWAAMVSAGMCLFGPTQPIGKAAAYHKKNFNVHTDQICELQYMLFIQALSKRHHCIPGHLLQGGGKSPC